MQDYAKCMVYYIFFVGNNKKSPEKQKQKTKENKKKTKENNNKTINTKCASKLLRVRFAYVF